MSAIIRIVSCHRRYPTPGAAWAPAWTRTDRILAGNDRTILRSFMDLQRDLRQAENHPACICTVDDDRPDYLALTLYCRAGALPGPDRPDYDECDAITYEIAEDAP